MRQGWALGLMLAGAAWGQVRGVLDFDGHEPRYRLGEPIRLALRFTAPAAQALVLLEWPFSRAGPGGWGRFTAEPAARDPLARLYARRPSVYRGRVDERRLSEGPVRVELDLNDYLAFDRPGRYRVRFVCRAAVRAEGVRDYRDEQLPEQLFELEILPRDRAWEEEVVSTATWRTGPLEERVAAMRRLRFLNSELALEELVAGVLSDEHRVAFEARAGLYGLADGCAVLERVRRAPAHPQRQEILKDLEPCAAPPRP